MDFKNKNIWITGASAGIGAALAMAFDKENANLILSARNEKALKKVVSDCTGTGKKLIVLLDVAKHDLIPGIAEQVQAQVGAIDVLINNAGISQRGLVNETDLAVDKRIMDINYFGAIALTKAILPGMLAQKSGSIIAMSSLTGKFGTALRSTYAASKHALHGFYDSLRCEVHKDNIHVMLVCPGFIKTNISINAVTADGSATGKMDDAQNAGMLPSLLAQKIMKAIKKRKEEAYFGGTEVLGIYVKRLFPKLFSRIIRNRKVT